MPPKRIEYFCQVGPGRDKNLSSRQGRKMPDIGLEAVLADEYDRETASGLGQGLDVQGVALPIGDEEYVTSSGLSRYNGERSPDLGPARGSSQPSHQ